MAIAEHDPNVYLSARNIGGTEVSSVSGLNALSVLRPRKMLVTKAALDAIKERAQAKGAGEAAPAEKEEA